MAMAVLAYAALLPNAGARLDHGNRALGRGVVAQVHLRQAGRNAFGHGVLARSCSKTRRCGYDALER
jgi:hypothetical protein